MNTKKQSTSRARIYSIIALVIALLGCIATFFLAVVRGLYAMQLFSGIEKDDLNTYLLIAAAVLILGLALYAVFEPDKVRRLLTGRQARYGSNTLIMSIAFLGILIVGNLLAYRLANQNPDFNWDMTEDQANTLSPELTQALEAIPDNVTATAFFSTRSNTAGAEELLGKIQANSKGKFTYQFINSDRDRQAALDAGITGDGKILLEMSGRQEIVAYASEAEILKGLARLTNPGNNVVYFLTGHGELDVEQAGDASMTRARETLESKNYTVKTVNLQTEKQVPEDASVIVIAGPLKPVTQEEVDMLKGYLAKGGSLVVMENPTALTQFDGEADPLAAMLAQEWGITLNDDIVIDLDSPEITMAAAAYYENHPITVSMNRIAAYFPYSRSLSITTSGGEVTASPLVETNERSWGETDSDSLRTTGQVEIQEGETLGPLVIAAASSNATTQGRVVVFGTSNFAIDQMFDTAGNGDMFVNSVDWAAEQEQGIGITPKTPTMRTFNAPAAFQGLFILLGSVFVIPGLVILWGISTWMTRRRQG